MEGAVAESKMQANTSSSNNNNNKDVVEDSPTTDTTNTTSPPTQQPPQQPEQSHGAKPEKKQPEMMAPATVDWTEYEKRRGQRRERPRLLAMGTPAEEAVWSDSDELSEAEPSSSPYQQSVEKVYGTGLLLSFGKSHSK